MKVKLTINYQEYIMMSGDAITLIEIFDRAQKVKRGYIDKKMVYYLVSPVEIDKIEVVSGTFEIKTKKDD